MNLIKIQFTCPFCSKDKITLADKQKIVNYQEKGLLIQDVFSPISFPATYREIFISHICSACQKSVFDSEDDTIYDVDDGESTDNLEALITKMYENAERQ